MKDLKAFVSSTYEDLKQHRAHVINALRDAGVSVDPMENWTATNAEPKTFCSDGLQGCDLCVLLVARRRGYIPDGESKSITQLEYEAAIKNGIDVLVFLLDDDADWKRKWDETDKDEKLREWREELMGHHVVKFFSHDPTSIAILPAYSRWIAGREMGDQQVKTMERRPAPPPGPPPEPVAAPKPIVVQWDGDGMSVVVRVCKQHPNARAIRETLVSQLGLDAKGVWLATRTIYGKQIVPAIERLCGKGSCPQPP